MPMDLHAPAKINLFLDVLGKRPDGYHEIRSLLLPVSLFDRIRLELTDGAIVTVDDSEIRFAGLPWPASMGPSDANLATRAARLFQEVTGYKGGARIIIDKQIPVAGGLGGGSSDAAAVLTGLNRLWNINWPQSELMALGARLGCDIPALIHGGSLCMEGRGERITPVPITNFQSFWIVLVYPGFGVATADIYARFKPDLTAPAPDAKFRAIWSGLKDGALTLIAEGLYNALQQTVFWKYPLLEIIKNELVNAGAPGVLLSGSGSTIFALARTIDQGRQLETAIRQAVSCPIWTAVAQTIGKMEAGARADETR